MHALLALVATNPALFVGIVSIFVFFTILAVRKFFPKAWFYLEGKLSFLTAIDNEALFAFMWKALQAIPGTLVGVLMTALASGGDPITMLLGALAGIVAAIGHEVIKRYSGQVGKVSAAVVLALALAFGSVSLTACSAFKPAVVAQVPNDVALAFGAAGSALAIADVVVANYAEGIEHPTDAQLADVSAVVAKLQDVKDSLDDAKADLATGRSKLRSALADLKALQPLLDLAGIKVPPAFASAVAALEGISK